METPVTEDELPAIVEHLRTYIDPSIAQTDTMADLKHRKRLSEFMQSHCQLRHYHFSVKKCGKQNCAFCFDIQMPQEDFDKLHFLPDPVPEENDHYKSFQVWLLS